VKNTNQTTAKADLVNVTRIVRDETCPACGWPETFAEVDLTSATPGAEAFGCNKCGWRNAAPAAPEPIYYQPEHDEETRGRIALALARRGYVLTTDEAALDMLSVIVEGDGSLSINYGDLGAGFFPVGEYGSPEEYAEVMADWFEMDEDDEFTGPREPGAAEKATRDAEATARAEWIAGMRSLLDLLEAEPGIRLPRMAKDPVKFYVQTSLDSATIARHLEGIKIADRPGCIFRYETTGRMGAVDVAVYTGSMTGVSE
jgi:hypothetical protein